MSEKVMRAKVVVSRVEQVVNPVTAKVSHENLSFRAVCKEDGPYPADGQDENNTFALFTPTLDLSMTINNPALFGKIKQGQKLYLTFEEAEK